MFPAAIYAPARAIARESPRPGYKWELLVLSWVVYLFGAAVLFVASKLTFSGGSPLAGSATPPTALAPPFSFAPTPVVTSPVKTVFSPAA